MENLYGSYRDGLDGRKDLRSLTSLYFNRIRLIFVVIAVQSEDVLVLTTLSLVRTLYVFYL